MYQTSPIATKRVDESFADGVIRLLWCTDSHLLDTLDSRDTNLRSAIADCNEWKPTAFLHTGDIGDNTLERVQRAFNNLKLCRRPVIAVVGNHDENELVVGESNSSLIANNTAFNRNPLYYSTSLSAPDGSWSALVLVLDCNFYDDDPDGDTPGDSTNHEPGDRIGYHSSNPSGGYFRQFGATQLAWVESALAISNHDAILLFLHYPPGGVSCTDYADLVDLIQADGRDAIGFCGHVHPDAKSYSVDSNDTLYSLMLYKCPAMQESGSWTRLELSYGGGVISADTLEVHNFTNPGAWTIDTPFEVV